MSLTTVVRRGPVELPTTNTCFRVVARAGLALESPSETRWLQPVQARRLAEHARGLVGSLLTRRDSQVKEALGAVLDAVSVLEREIGGLGVRVE